MGVPRKKERQYSKEIIEYATKDLETKEKEVYMTIFSDISTRHGIESAEDSMLLHRVVMSFMRTIKLDQFLEQYPLMLEYDQQDGSKRYKANEAAYLLNSIEMSMRATMKELSLTRKETVKKKIMEGSQDFAKWLNAKEVVIDGDTKPDTK